MTGFFFFFFGIHREFQSLAVGQQSESICMVQQSSSSSSTSTSSSTAVRVSQSQPAIFSPGQHQPLSSCINGYESQRSARRERERCNSRFLATSSNVVGLKIWGIVSVPVEWEYWIVPSEPWVGNGHPSVEGYSHICQAHRCIPSDQSGKRERAINSVGRDRIVIILGG